MSKRSLRLDEIDIKILKELQKNGRISNIELSTLVGISPSPCLRRLRNLEDAGVIKGYLADINEKIFDFNLIMFASISIEVENEKERDIFENELSKITEIREIYNLSLESDYLLKILVRDWIHYKGLITTKVSKVPYIKKIRTTQITRTIKQESGFEIS